MTSFWKTMADVTREKLNELGIVGSLLGLIWVVGLWVWYDWMMGAYREGVPESGTMMLWILIAWLIVGMAIYLWRDPHGVRESMV